MASKTRVDPKAIAALNAAFSKTRTSGGSRPVRRSSTKLSGAQIAALAAAFGGGGSSFGGTPQDYLASAQAKLSQSIANINNSNAPMGSKVSATGEAVGMGGESKSFLDRLLDVVNKPLAVTTSAVARIADPKRNFLKDVRANVTPAEIFATQNWFKKLGTPAQLAVGLGSAIALDPLTYLAPSAKLAKLGNAAGLARKADEAAILAKTAGQTADAKKLGDIAGRLLTKKGGGIGGLANDELAYLGKQIGEDSLKGGLYLNVPGTGSIAQRVGLANEVKQIPLGRYDWMRKVSSGASKGLGGIKTSKVMSQFGDAAKGGEGELKRAILNAKTPREARNRMRVLDSARVRNGAEAVYGMNRAKSVDEIRKIATENGIDPTTMTKAIGGNQAAVAEIEAVVPGFTDQLLAHEDAWRPASQQVGGSQLEQLGIHPDEMGNIYQNNVDFHQSTGLTEEALAAGVGSAKGNKGRVRGPQLPRRITYGQEFLGETLRHPTKWTQRIVRRNSKGEVKEVLGVGVGRGKAGLEAAQADAKFALKPDGTEVIYQTFDKQGRPVYKTLPVGEVSVQKIPPSKGGLGVREQANALNKNQYGYDLFEMDYFKGQDRAMSEYAALHGQEVQAAYLRRYTKTKLKDFPKGPKEARAAIAKAQARLEEAVVNVKDARIRTIVAESEGFVNIAEADARLQAAIDNLNKVMSSTPKDSKRLIELRNELAAVQAERAGLHARINKAADLIESKTASTAEIELELNKLLSPNAGSKPVAGGGAASTVPVGAAEPSAAAGAVVDPNSKDEVYRRLLETTNKEKQSALRDKQFEYDSIRVEPGAPKADIAAVKKELAQAQKEADATAQALAGYNEKIPPQAVAAPVVPETAAVAVVPEVGAVGAAVPEAATGVPVADVGTTTDGLKPLDSLKSGDKPTLVGPLDRFTDVMYRETSPDRALNMIPDASGIRGDLPDMFAANSPEYALGQGANKGAMVEMDTAGLTGKVSSKKPGWKQMYQDGYAEFSIQFNNSDAIQSSIRSITLDQTVLAKDKLLTRQWKNARTRLKSQGWTEEVLADGKIRLSRPDISGSPQIGTEPISAAGVPTPTAAGAGTPTTPMVEPAAGTVPLAPAEEFRSVFGYPRDEAVAAIGQRNTLQESIQNANDAIDTERAALATKAAQSPNVQGEGKAVEAAKREVGFAVRELNAAQKAGKSEKWIGTLNKRLDKARQSLREAEAIRKLEVEQLIAKGSQDNKKIKNLQKQIAKDEAALAKLQPEAPFAFPGFDDNYAFPPRMEYQGAPNVTRESALETLTPAQRKEMLRVEQVYNVPADKMPEVIARRQAYDTAAKNHADLIAANAPDEVVAAAEWQMRGAQRDMRVVDEAMLQRSVQQADTVAAARRAAAESELGIDTTNRIRNAVPPDGGYSPEWESSTLQFADDSRQARAAIDDVVTTRISDLRKELKSAKRATKAGTTPRAVRREVAAIEDELLGMQMAQDLSSRVTVEADAAVLSAIAEKAAYEEYLIELAKLEAKNATLPTGFKITLGQASGEPLANRVLTAGRKYEQAQIQTVLTAQDSAQAAKAASFASTTTNLSSDQVARLGAAVSEGTVDDTIKQIVREFALEPAQKKVVQQATKQVGNDPQAVTAIHAVAGDPVQTQKVVKASKAKQSAAATLGVEPGSVPSSAQTKKVTAKARKRIEELRSELDKQVRSGKRLTAAQAKRYAELGEIDGRLAGYSKKISQLEKRKQALYESKKASAWAELDQADRIAAGELERAQRAIELAAVGEAQALKSYGKALNHAEYTQWLRGSQAEEAVRYVVRKGYQEISMTSQAPNDIAEALAMVTRITAPKELPGFFKYFDEFTRIFKSWAVATPGFIARNGYSGVFMNYMFGVSPGSMRDFVSADRAFNRAIGSGKSVVDALAELPDGIRDSYALVHHSGVLELGGQVENVLSDLKALTGSGAKRSVLTRIADTPLNRATYKMNGQMERYLRGSAAMDAAAKGRGIEGIYDLVFKAHFDYSDLNNFENNVMKRISPFYTWFRKNLPTQMEMIFRNPKAFARFAQAKDAIEATTNPEDIVPSWMTDRLNIRLPFSIPGGQMYLMPDMPIKDLNVLGNWNDALGMINPVLKTPVELTMDRKLYFGQSAPFVGLVQLPSYMESTGLGEAAEALGFAQRSADGQLMMQDKYLYALEQFMPFLGRSRRLLPNEPRYQDRLPVTVLNTLFGLSVRANTTSDKQGEIYFRQQKIDKLAENLQKLGYGGYDYWQKQVALASKPSATDKRPYLTLLQPKGGLPSSSPFTNVSSTKPDLAKAFATYLAQNGSPQ